MVEIRQAQHAVAGRLREVSLAWERSPLNRPAMIANPPTGVPRLEVTANPVSPEPGQLG
jgi:hypothetical protein